MQDPGLKPEMHQENYNTQTEIKRQSRTGEYKLWRAKVVDAYRSADMPDDADLFEGCSDPSHFFMLHNNEKMQSDAVAVIACSENPAHFAKAICPTCQLRTCPDCAHRSAARLLARYMPELEKHYNSPRMGWRFRKIVLTTAVSLHNEDLRERIKALHGDVRKLFDRLLWTHKNGPYRVAECGLIVAHEFGPKGLKLHFHILYYGPYLVQAQIADEWQSLTGWNQVRIKGVGRTHDLDLAGAVAEQLKYTTKFWKRQKNGDVVYIDPAIVPIIHKALAGTRRVRSWGLFYNIAIEEEPALCGECGAAIGRFSPTEYDIWTETGWLPEEFARALRPEIVDHLFLKHGNKSPPADEKKEYLQELLL